MLQSLSIRNFAIIDRWDVSFFEGETAVTGETGAGKSIFVESLCLLRGDKASKTLLRADGSQALVEAAFLVDADARAKLEEIGFALEENLIVLQRTISEKSSQVRIDGRISTVQSLKEVASILFDVHAQNSQTVLSDRKNYLHLVDRFGQEQILPLLASLQVSLQKAKEITAKLDALDISPEEVEREKEILTFQIAEIDAGNLTSYDEDALNEEYRNLTTAVDRAQTVTQAIAALETREDGVDSPSDVMRAIAKHVDIIANDDVLKNAVDKSYQIEAEIESLHADLEQYLNAIDIDPERVAEIDQVFRQVMALKRKYGNALEDILAFRDESAARLKVLDDIEQTRDSLQKDLAKEEKISEKIADQLTKARREVADALERRIAAELVEMNIRKLSFAVHFEDKPQITDDGKDKIDFSISTNPGEPMKSVSEVASGGEMSRFMLAFKIVAADYDSIGTLIFDEIDTGISGRTAQVVGEKILHISEDRQVICITHLPQIAALADQHYLIYKAVNDAGKTSSHIVSLVDDARAEEQARLIGGVDITNVTRAHAKEMLQQAQALRDKSEK